MIEKQRTIVFGGTKGIGKTISKVLKYRGDFVITSSRRKLNKENHLTIDLNSGQKIINKSLNSYFSLYKKKISNLIFCQRYRGDNEYDDFEVSLHSSSHIINYFQNLLTKNASIVLISSIAIKTVLDDQPLSYHVTRSGIDQMAKYYAIKLGNRGIRCNCILPTKIIKPENKKFYLKKGNKITKLIKKITPLNKMGSSDDVANLVDFLTSKKSTFLTGLTIPVDGGLSLLSQESITNKFNKPR